MKAKEKAQIKAEAQARCEITEGRRDLVVQSNEFLRKGRSIFSEGEQKLILYLIAKTELENERFIPVKVPVKEYCKISGMSLKNKNLYADIKDRVQALANKSWWMAVNGDKKRQTLCRWIDRAEVNERGYITVTLHESLKPFITNLKNNFTQYELLNILALKSKHSIRLYELCKSYLYLGEWEPTVQELRDALWVDRAYTKYYDFSRYCLKPAAEEINTYTDLKIKCTPIKQSYNVVAIHFDIEELKGVNATMDVWDAQAERLKKYSKRQK